LRRDVIKRIPIISSFIRGDFEVVKEVYGTNAKYIFAYYPIPSDHERGDAENDMSEEPVKDGPTLLIGNSGSPRNRHKEILLSLARFRDQACRVIVPLAYGDPVYIQNIIEFGREVLGDKFIALTEFQT